MRRALARARAPRAPALPRDARAGRAQKDEQSKLMKEYDKKNKENDMSLSSKKKEDFGACAHRAEILNWLCGAAPARRAWAARAARRCVPGPRGQRLRSGGRAPPVHARLPHAAVRTSARPAARGGDPAEPRPRAQGGEEGRGH